MLLPLIVANWKMHKTTSETRDFISRFLPLVKGIIDVEIVIAPAFTSLPAASEFLKGSNVKLSAQDVFWEEKGAYTGEVSPSMLRDLNCDYVIIGHSERRQFFCETDEAVNKKIKAARGSGLGVIFCIGESLNERESGKTFDVLKRQLIKGLKGVSHEGLVIAYEPVWAIGSGKTATPEQAQEAHQFIRLELKTLYSDKANTIRILYGGSVKPDNTPALMSNEDVDGALVGGASLEPDSFANIVKFK